MVMNIFGKREKPLSEIEEEQERLQAEDEKAGTELSLARKRLAIKELKKRGLSVKHFGDTKVGETWERAWSWLKNH